MTHAKLIEQSMPNASVEFATPVYGQIDRWSMVSSNEQLFPNTNQHAMYRSVIGTLIYLATRIQQDRSMAASMSALILHERSNAYQIVVKLAPHYFKETLFSNMNIKLGDGAQLTMDVDECCSFKLKKNREAVQIGYWFTETLWLWQLSTFENVSARVSRELSRLNSWTQPRQLRGFRTGLLKYTLSMDRARFIEIKMH